MFVVFFCNKKVNFLMWSIWMIIDSQTLTRVVEISTTPRITFRTICGNIMWLSLLTCALTWCKILSQIGVLTIQPSDQLKSQSVYFVSVWFFFGSGGLISLEVWSPWLNQSIYQLQQCLKSSPWLCWVCHQDGVALLSPEFQYCLFVRLVSEHIFSWA